MVEGAGSDLALVLQVDQEVQDRCGFELRKICLGEVGGELFNPTVVGPASALGEAFELDEAGVILIPLA